MDETIAKLSAVLGDDLLEKIASRDSTDSLNNSCEIRCDCDTIILKPNTAKLIPATDSMLDVERELSNYQTSGRILEEIVRGCYWLVDDMYKFEHMGYTKEINAQNLSQTSNSSILNGLRYLACAECNLCPLGWFDPNTKESYLHIWTNKKS